MTLAKDDKLVVNHRDELIQEMILLRNQKLIRETEAQARKNEESNKLHTAQKKNVYEQCFILLVKKYFKLSGDAGDLKDLSEDKIDELEKIIYELAKRRWKWQRIFFWSPAILIVPLPILFFMAHEETMVEVPAKQLLNIHAWYKENFGSIAKAIKKENA